MTKTTRIALAVLAVALFWLGCGVDEEPRRPRVGQNAEATDLSKMTIEERKQATAGQDELGPEFFVWPAGKPGERDAVADTRACREQALEREDFVRANGIVRFAILTKCMGEKGWTLDEEAVEAFKRRQAGL